MDHRIEIFSTLGSKLSSALSVYHDTDGSPLHEAVELSFHKNGWFTEDQVLFALDQWARMLNTFELKSWMQNYQHHDHPPKNIGLVLAGNIPLVGFHDVLSVLITGNRAKIKMSSSDNVMLPLIMNMLLEIEPAMADLIRWVPHFLKGHDAIIATGSNNSARYFEAYFKDVPHIIRRNRTSVAVLNGKESDRELAGLMEDAFRYFGLGCRNTTKLYLPPGYDVNKLFRASLPYADLMNHKKYANNYSYHRTLMMMQQRPVLENEVFLLLEDESPFSPVSVLHYEQYENHDALQSMLERDLESIQCITGANFLPFGQSQKPGLADYADGTDTVQFILNICTQEASK